MKAFNDWDLRIKIVGPIFYSLVITTFFSYDFLSSMAWGKMVALVLIIFGYSLMLIARFQLKDRFAIKPRSEKGIITCGIYRVVRHPIYISSSISALGVCFYSSILLNNFLLDIFLSFFLIAYVSMQIFRAKKEEKKMMEKYKEYAEYRQKTIF